MKVKKIGIYLENIKEIFGREKEEFLEEKSKNFRKRKWKIFGRYKNNSLGDVEIKEFV